MINSLPTRERVQEERCPKKFLEEHAMPDDIIVSINTPPKSVGSTSTPSGNRDEWLAQLEDAAFALRDDSLRPHQDDARNPSNGDHPKMPTDEPVSSTSAQEQSITDIQNVFSSRVNQQYLSRN